MPKVTLVRLYLASLAVCCGVWVWTAIELHQREKEDQEFYDTVVAPEIERVRAPTRTSDGVDKQEATGRLAPFQPSGMLRQEIMEEHLRRHQHRFDLHFRKNNALVAASFCTVVFVFGTMIQSARRKKRWEAPERPAANEISSGLLALLESKGRLVAKARGKSKRAMEVEIDAARLTVTFRHFAFIDSFARNPVRAVTEVPFSDLLVGTVEPGSRSGHLHLSLRTTRGRVFIPDTVEPFGTVADYLIGLAELNRANPDAYREALSREPVIRTPWWGWLTLAGGVGFIAWLGWLALYG